MHRSIIADDIDIEEHDILDNPVIKSIFPDISVIKKEISVYYEDVPNIKQETEITNTDKKPLTQPTTYTKTNENIKEIHEQTFKDRISKVVPDNSKIINNNLKQPFHGTKIILGSKPSKIVQQTEEVTDVKRQESYLAAVKHVSKLLFEEKDLPTPDYIKTKENVIIVNKQSPKDHQYNFNGDTQSTQKHVKKSLEGTKIILGSKPNKSAPQTTDLFETNTNETRKISLDSLVRVPKLLIQDLGEYIFQSDRYCEKCKTLFPSKSDFSIHKQTSHYTKTLNKPQIQHKKNTIKVISNNLKDILKITQSKNNANKCTICSSRFSNRANLSRHYRNIHNKKVSFKRIQTRGPNAAHVTSINKTRKSTRKIANSNLRNTCFHCNEKFPDQKLLIEHIYKVLEPKHSPNQKRNKVLATSCKEKCQPTTTERKREFGNVKTDETRKETFVSKSFKDKLFFEEDGSSTSSEVEKETKQNLKHKEMYEKTESKNDKSLNSHRSEPLKNKRKYDDQNSNSTDKNIRKGQSLDKRLISVTKKRKLDTQNLNLHRLTVTPESTSSGSLNKHKTDEKNKRRKSKNRLPSIVSKKEPKHQSSDNNVDNTTNVYECIYCSYLLLSSRSYYLHVLGKHKVENISRVNKATFNEQCKYCPSKHCSIKAHNTHVQQFHYDLFNKAFNVESEDSEGEEETSKLQTPEFKKIKSFVLKSIVYKCTKCDIHFLSSCVAKDHEKHMEMSRNWKCSDCKKIFKEHDKHLHLNQHKFCKTLNVCQFNQAELSRLLYNCTKCTIHFTEERYLEHYSKCDTETTDSVYCKYCDVLIDKCGYPSHKAYHEMGKNTEEFIVMTGDIITTSERQKHENEIGSVKKRTRLLEKINCLTFCKSCKCYLSDQAVGHKAHVESRCSKMVRYTCNLCGLVFSNKTINTHRNYHKIHRDLKLQDFNFFDLKGLQIRPPIPDYPRCNNCEVNFVGKNAIKNHICCETEYFTCQICNVKLTENALKLHMGFHNYYLPNEKRNKWLDKKEFDDKELRQKDVESKRCAVSSSILGAQIQNANNSKALVAKELLQQTTKLNNGTKTSNVELCNNMSRKDQSKSDIIIPMVSQKDDSILDTRKATSNGLSRNVEETEKDKSQANIHTESSSELCTDIESEHKDVKKVQQINKGKNVADNSSKSRNIVFTCLSCQIAIDTYDKVIQHCQKHFTSSSTYSSPLKTCSKCSLKFEMGDFETHQKLHLRYDNIQILTFDPTYFTADNNIWKRHIFASVTPLIQQEVIAESKYQHECRIIMETIQQGPSHLTVYKCWKCGNFIDPGCLIAHIQEACHKKMRKYPCSICGLPLISSEFRNKHEKLHKLHNNVRLKSYNIMLINCAIHKNDNTCIINAMNKYALYQCRKCDGIVDKLQRNDHKCCVDDLQKCEICGLILYKNDFMRHISKHSELPMYNVDNMKVILFGNVEESSQNKTLVPSFSGTTCDYELYKCSKCEVCVNDTKLVSRHVCTFDDSKWKCPKCGFYISTHSIKQHIKFHDIDKEFQTNNIKIIYFGLAKDTTNEQKENHDFVSNKSIDNRESEKERTETLEHNNTANNTEDNTNKESESVSLYKCACGLHYMDESTAINHVKDCSTKVRATRQNCSKCSLAFNPKELFSHIIKHHSAKNKLFKCDVIEVTAEFSSNSS